MADAPYQSDQGAQAAETGIPDARSFTASTKDEGSAQSVSGTPARQEVVETECQGTSGIRCAAFPLHETGDNRASGNLPSGSFTEWQQNDSRKGSLWRSSPTLEDLEEGRRLREMGELKPCPLISWQLGFRVILKFRTFQLEDIEPQARWFLRHREEFGYANFRMEIQFCPFCLGYHIAWRRNDNE